MVDSRTSPIAPEQRIKELGIELTAPPTPLGAYVQAVRSGNLVFLSGMLPVVEHVPLFIGRMGGNLSVEDGRKAAATATINGLSTAKAFLGSLDRISAIAKLGVYIASEAEFREHAKVADGASELLVAIFGSDRLPARVVLGVASLPLGVPIEVELLLEVHDATAH